MLFTAIISIAYYLGNALVNLFPTSTGLPSEVHTAATALGGYLGVANTLLPVPTLATTVGIVFSVEIAIFGYKTLKSFLTHVPLVGGK